MLGFIHPIITMSTSFNMVKFILARFPVGLLLRGGLSFFQPISCYFIILKIIALLNLYYFHHFMLIIIK